MFGILNVHKPAGVTSRDVVNQIQRLTASEKVGHAGTLDPLATGVLVICIGPATRLIEYVQRMPKRYRGTFLLGRRSDTEDVEGVVEELIDPPQPTREQIEAVLPQFVGRIMQRPPSFSALKVDGKRSYDRARQGEVFELEARPIDVFFIRVLRYEYPELELDIHCGSGTYVRSLGRDIAQAVGTAAVMSALVRTEIGPFHVQAEDENSFSALDPESLTRATLPEAILPPETAVACLPQVRLPEALLVELRHGRGIAATEAVEAGEIAILDESGRLTALVNVLSGDGKSRWQPFRVFK